MRAIISCDCAQTPEYAKDAYSLLYPNTETPPLYTSFSRLIEETPQHSNVRAYLTAISKTKRKFAYFLEWDEDGNVTTNINLLTGKKVA